MPSEIIVACCGTSTVAWNPQAASSQERAFSLQQESQVSSSGWLNTRALATAGEQCVVSIYGVREKKKVDSVPRPEELPSKCSPITSLAVLRNDTVACGHEDGTLASYLLVRVWLLRKRVSGFGDDCRIPNSKRHG
jgi:hypothetical protein